MGHNVRVVALVKQQQLASPLHLISSEQQSHVTYDTSISTRSSTLFPTSHFVRFFSFLACVYL